MTLSFYYINSKVKSTEPIKENNYGVGALNIASPKV